MRRAFVTAGTVGVVVGMIFGWQLGVGVGLILALLALYLMLAGTGTDYVGEAEDLADDIVDAGFD